MVILRWILFLPAGIVAGMIVSALFRFTARAMFPEIIEVVLCGMSGAVALILVGLKVAPKRTAAVKWTLIIMTALLGGLASLGVLVGPEEDKFQAITGLTAFITALLFVRTKAGEFSD